MARTKKPKTITAITHEDSRKNIPTAEYQSVMKSEERQSVQVAYERRNRDLDPQLVWRGKDEQDAEPLVAQAPPLYIQEKVHPKVLIDSLKRYSREENPVEETIDLFADFNGLPDGDARTEFYQHEANWSNRMILGDSLHVMASLAEREGLRGKVQCIYMDPPYGIKFNSNFQWSTTSRDVKDGNKKHITREPEQVKAFRDTWRDGVHSYLAYLRDRLTAARDLLTDEGSIFVQIGEENVHRVRALLDEVFGHDNSISTIGYKTSIGLGSQYLDNTINYLLWYAKDRAQTKFRRLYKRLEPWKKGATRYKRVRLPDLTERRVTSAEVRGTETLPSRARIYRDQGLTSRTGSSNTVHRCVSNQYRPPVGGRTSESECDRGDRVLRTQEHPLCQQGETRREKMLRVGRGRELQDGTRRRNEDELSSGEGKRSAAAAPDPEVTAKASRRRTSCQEGDACETPGEIGRLLRREGLYSSHLSGWRKAAREGSLRGGSAARCLQGGSEAKQVRKLEREVARLREELRTRIVIEVQGAGLLGLSLGDGKRS